LVFLDETGIDRFLYREYGRAKKGEKIMAEVSGKKFERQSIVAAQCGEKVLAPFGYHGTCDAKLFNFWLEKFLVPLLKPGQIVIMDNASIHKTNTTQSIINKAGCKLLFLPPYSPDLNPIEHLWSNLKRKLRNILHKFSSLQDALCACFS
jgi:transposase